MIVAHITHRGHKRWNPLIDFARKEGWAVSHTPDGHLTFTKPGLPSIYAGPITGIIAPAATLRPNPAEQNPSLCPITREADSDG